MKSPPLGPRWGRRKGGHTCDLILGQGLLQESVKKACSWGVGGRGMCPAQPSAAWQGLGGRGNVSLPASSQSALGISVHLSKVRVPYRGCLEDKWQDTAHPPEMGMLHWSPILRSPVRRGARQSGEGSARKSPSGWPEDLAHSGSSPRLQQSPWAAWSPPGAHDTWPLPPSAGTGPAREASALPAAHGPANRLWAPPSV